MKWDTAKLTAKLVELQSRYDKINNPTQKYLLDNDIGELKTMLNHVSNGRPYSFTEAEKQFPVLDRQTFDEMVNFLKRACPLLAEEFSGSKIHSAPIKIALPHYISEKELDFLVEEFLTAFDQRLLNLYKSYKVDQRIHLGKEPFGNQTCKGKCFPMAFDGESYIYSQFTHRLNQVSTLLHEFGHANQYKGITDAIAYQRRLYSVFGESYPLFIQYCFYDFLQNTKYKNEALMEESFMLDSIFVYMDYFAPNLYNVQNAQYLENNVLGVGGYYQMSRNLELIFSELLALQWLYLYRQDRDLAMKDIEGFNSTYGQATVEEIYNLYGAEVLYQGVISNVHDYCRRRYR